MFRGGKKQDVRCLHVPEHVMVFFIAICLPTNILVLTIYRVIVLELYITVQLNKNGHSIQVVTNKGWTVLGYFTV